MKRRHDPFESEDGSPVRRYVARVFYCENCGRRVSSYENEDGIQKISCDWCGLRYVRKWKGRRHWSSDMYAPDWATFDIDEAM